MGRFENIIARNRRPHGLRASFGLVWRGLFLLLILGLLIFTDWALTDDAGGAGDGDGLGAPMPRPPASGGGRLEGVPMMRAPATPR